MNRAQHKALLSLNLNAAELAELEFRMTEERRLRQRLWLARQATWDFYRDLIKSRVKYGVPPVEDLDDDVSRYA